jgi:hypothetical protein
MHRGAIIAWLVCGLAVSGNVGIAAAAGPRPLPPKLIYKVDSVAASIQAGKLSIIAAGAVSSGGWSKVRLRLRPGHKPESDTLEFELVASPPPPGEAVIQALVPVSIATATKLPPYGVTQIRVYSETDSTTAPITH